MAEPSSDKKIFYLHVKYITNAILLEKDFVGNGKIFKALHGIVDGEIDCDRLDYVSRDAMASGIFSGSIEYERLYKSMKLLETEQGFLFCPSSHILGTIEDFFNRRWRMYKNIIFHHRVAKTDTLLREVIELLAERYLSEDSKEVKINGFKIPDDISGLWKTLDSELLEGSEDDALFCIIQWDDAWLLACLRNEYFKISTSSDDSNFEILSRLEELLSNRKKYASLFKRFDGFAELDSVISKEINYELLEQNNDDKVSLLKLKERLEFINRIYNENKKPAQLCTYEIFEYFKKKKAAKQFDTIIENALIKVLGETKYFIYKPNNIKIGIGEAKNPAKVHKNQEVYLLENYSNIKTQLLAEKGLFAPFYIYIHIDKFSDSLENLRKSIGEAIAEEINNYFKDNSN